MLQAAFAFLILALVAGVMGMARTEILAANIAWILFVVFLVEFMLVPKASTSLFFLLTLLTAFDVVVGSIIGIRTARRDIGFSGPGNSDQ